MSALIGLLNRVNSVKVWGLEVGVCPPEDIRTIKQGVNEKHIEIKRTSLHQGVSIMPPEGVKIVKKTIREIEQE